MLLREEQEPFHIHEDLILGDMGALTSHYLKSTEGNATQIKVYLPFAKAKSFRILVDYLYQGDFFTKTMLYPQATTITPYINAWTLSNLLDMEDAKNAIMNWIRNVISSSRTAHSFYAGHSSGDLSRTALASIQNTGAKYDRHCQVRNLLVNRSAFDMVNSSTTVTAGEPPKLIATIQALYDKGGQYATDFLTH